MPPPLRTALWAGVLLFVSLAGCEDGVDPTLGTEQVFSVYGYLDPTADRQALRVVPITATIEADTSRTLDATVTSVEPATGRTAVWRDSTMAFLDGSVGHIFVADYTPTPGVRVELLVTAGDGREATVAVETPPLARPTVGAPLVGLGETVYPVSVVGVPRVIGGTLRLFVTGQPGQPGPSILTVPVTSLRIRNEAGVWVVEVPFLAATKERLQNLGLFNAGLTLLEAEFAPFVANDEWDVPADGFDEDQIIEPGTFSNVNGGFGFVGAGYRAPVRWVPSTAVQSQAGFEVTNDPAALVAVNEIGSGYVEVFNPALETIDLSGYRLTTEAPGRAREEIVIPGGSRLAPGAFLTFEGPFAATDGALVQLLTASGRLLKNVPILEGGTAWGAYPDGYSYRIPRSPVDVFYGPVIRSPGGPNRPAEVLAAINEVSPSGDGFVEVIPLAPEFGEPVLASSGEGLVFQPVGLQFSESFLVATEGGGLPLDQLGGAVFLMINFQVVDARFYGPQSPDRSEGYLPDGPQGTWTPGLRPTRGSPNALARFGL